MLTAVCITLNITLNVRHNPILCLYRHKMRSATAAANIEVKHQTAEAPPNDIKLEECGAYGIADQDVTVMEECVAYGVAEENLKVPEMF